MQVPGEQRDRISPVVFTSTDPTHALGRFDTAMVLCYQAEGVVSKVKAAIKRRELPRQHPATLIPQALEAGVITADEAAILKRAEEARNDAIQVDSFDNDDYFATAIAPDAVPSATGDGALGDGAPAIGEVGFGGTATTESGATTWSGAVVTQDPAAQESV